MPLVAFQPLKPAAGGTLNGLSRDREQVRTAGRILCYRSRAWWLTRTHEGLRVCVRTKRKPQISPLRYPGFPVDLDGVGRPHAPFLKRKAHTRPCLAPRRRKSGFASVGM